ncbi:MAG: curli assembly protein CsgF [Vicingaceae bacterium]
MIGLFFPGIIAAQDFVYSPSNPMLGGDDTFMYQQLLSSANAQNTIEEDPNANDPRLGRDPLTDFQESLNRQILSQLSRNLVSSQFGEDGITPGTYVLGDYQIDVTEGGSGIEVVILDEVTGNQTTVIIPYF